MRENGQGTPPPPSDNGENQVGGPDDIQFDVAFTNTHMNIWINNKEVVDVQGSDSDTEYKGTISEAGEANATKNNVLRFQANYGDYPVNEFTINGVKYTEDSPEVEIREGEGWLITVPGAEKYTITGKGDETAIIPRTIIWVNPDYVPKDAADAKWVKDFTIEHGYARIIEAYGADGRLINPNDYIGQDSDEYGLNKGFGWATFFPGTRVVFEFVPEYGYQLTGIAINETPLEAVEAVNLFEVEIPNGNLHFAATFSKIDDIVKAESEKVESGTIELAENSIEAGTVQLTVSDVELDENKLNGFAEEAGTAIIKNILDIDLYQVFYKGKNDSTDVWSNQIEELNGDAEITLKLGDDVDVKNVVLIHNIHDGDEYEIIEIIGYDEEAHTITFRTKSFSNYAIAEKPEKTPVHIVIKDLKSNVIIAFFDSEGHNLDEFEFMAMDFTNLTDEQIVALGVTKADYEKGLKKIKENSEEYGGLIVLYNLQLSIPKEDINLTEGPFTLRIPYTDKLKGYENIKLAYVDEETFELKEVIELKLEDGYLVGELEHLSPYALVGKAVPEETENTGNNPSTGDNIVIFGTIFVLSALAMGFEILVIKKSKNYR